MYSDNFFRNFKNPLFLIYTESRLERFCFIYFQLEHPTQMAATGSLDSALLNRALPPETVIICLQS